MATIKSYRDLEVWKQGIDLVEQCYLRSEHFPRTEEFGLRAQESAGPASPFRRISQKATGNRLLATSSGTCPSRTVP